MVRTRASEVNVQMIGSLVVLALASIAFVPTAEAQVCGNNVLERGESCDDGNTVGGDCCSATCVLAAAGTICRASTAPCDVAERCDGELDVCPADTGPSPDRDADGKCDALDICPDVADPQQLDRDFDGVGDLCDPCTNLADAEISVARLRIRKLHFETGSQRIKLKGSFPVAATPVFDPVMNGMRFAVTSDGATVLDVFVPPGELDPTADPDERRGWLQRGSVFQYDDREGTMNGIQRITARQASPTELRVLVLGRGGTYPLPDEGDLTMTFVADPPRGQRQCADVVFDRCRFKNAGGKLVCH